MTLLQWQSTLFIQHLSSSKLHKLATMPAYCHATSKTQVADAVISLCNPIVFTKEEKTGEPHIAEVIVTVLLIPRSCIPKKGM